MCEKSQGVEKINAKNVFTGSFPFIFGLFQTSINTVFQQVNVTEYPSSIRCWDSNPHPSEHESLPITLDQGVINC